jgi:hypothetical protein
MRLELLKEGGTTVVSSYDAMAPEIGFLRAGEAKRVTNSCWCWTASIT